MDQGFDRYGSDVLASGWKERGRPVVREVPVERGLLVELLDPEFVGEVVRIEGRTIELEDRRGRRRAFPLGPGYLVDGQPVVLVPPRAVSRGTGRTASGSLAVTGQRARVARASRILVEGRHDAELVEKVWGADLRIEGIVVEYLEGVDHLQDALREYQPRPGIRIGVLVDHLVPGSKEQRIADAVQGEHVLVVGHPYVDVWQSVRPERLGLERWPEIPRGTDWKHGILDHLGWPHEDQADVAAAWQRILGRVRGYTDLEPSLLGRVEELIDFVTQA
ncbi:DUF3097 domain-containing protein [Homoserinibacter sp. YIM 151385]|uniref:DUF3097 domain-containing protein n=1 Tax=Homoserinibacter sp. YIM 151385 TaxID=2985506 RepID=UPI0022F12C05|nr:DUF3097 domain-containing protein [Homoserinibacter sp. YIM 151385]WBU39359.1 DUF3097 domain-containing protein [Homoserinibacter sp. YIM 151385]